MVVLWGGSVLMSEGPLYRTLKCRTLGQCLFLYLSLLLPCGTSCMWSRALPYMWAPTVQGYFTQKKTPTPIGPPKDPRHRPTVQCRVLGGGGFLLARYPCRPIGAPPRSAEDPGQVTTSQRYSGVLGAGGIHPPRGNFHLTNLSKIHQKVTYK